jgi:sigma-B regulation protein RsbU (phosphoserine phosphatase)
MVLGVDPDEPYAQSFVELRHGDVLLLYTDGLTEAMNFENQMFGRQRIMEALATGGKNANEIAENIKWALQRFVGLRRQSDDISMIVAKLL